jgi:hypothetical protein
MLVGSTRGSPISAIGARAWVGRGALSLTPKTTPAARGMGNGAAREWTLHALSTGQAREPESRATVVSSRVFPLGHFRHNGHPARTKSHHLPGTSPVAGRLMAERFAL